MVGARRSPKPSDIFSIFDAPFVISGAVRLATRGSALARIQTTRVAELLAAAHPGITTIEVVVETSGDRRHDVPIHSLGGQGVFVKEVQQALIDGRADLAVHSAKDLPSGPTAGLVIAAVPSRADARDALVGRRLDQLAEGATVATGSVRRRAQLAGLRPDLAFADLRGNIGTRLDRIPPGGAIVVAAAALERLGLADRVAEVLDPRLMLPQVGQGALAIECRSDDGENVARCAAIDDPVAHRNVDAERSFLSHIGGGCELPVAGWARTVDGQLILSGLIASLDGRTVLRAELRRGLNHSAEVGPALADELLHDLGGASLLAALGGP
jgi:hydroxymethylbilane synthase